MSGVIPGSAMSVAGGGPRHAAPGSPWLIERLWQARDPSSGPVRGGALPAGIAARFAGSLEVALHRERPTVIANFVSSLDGVVALDRRGLTGGRAISGGSEPDRFMMGLLRATADAVLLGAGTYRASRGKTWTPEGAHPPSSPGFVEWRRMLGLPAAGPTTVIVSGSGALDLGALSDAGAPVVVVTTTQGAQRLRAARRPARVEIVPVAGIETVASERLLAVLQDRGHRLVLSEAGPTTFGDLLSGGFVDELFLTLAPQLVGRSPGGQRLSLVEGSGFPPTLPRWTTLRTAMRSGDHLFLRYDLHPDRGRAA